MLVLNHIYGYSTDSDREKGWAKIGQTTNQTVDDRIRQQDTSSNSEPLKKLCEIRNVRFTDHQIRNEIERLGLGYPVRKEWMFIKAGADKVAETIQKAINSLALGVVRSNSFGLRPWQRECHDKAVNAFNSGYDKFLIGAVMRFGKTFTCLKIAESLGVKAGLIITGKPEVRDSWRDELQSHVDFVGWDFVDLRDGNLSVSNIDFNKNNLFFVSFQYLLTKAEGVDKTWIYDLPIDLILTDEEHYGSKTEKSANILNKFGSVRTIAMSGTPIESRRSGRYEDGNSFYWSYLDAVQSNSTFPNLRIHAMDVAKSVVREAKTAGFVGDEAFNIAKVFATENGKFLYESDVRSLFEKVFDLRAMSRNRRRDSPERITGLQSDNFSHILMRVPYSVDAASAAVDLLRELLPDREIVLAAGSANGAVTNINEVKRRIAQNNKTITVTCGRFETGVTVPEWGAVYLFDGGRSPESFWQFIFRASTPLKTDSWEKKDFYVFDFDPHRSLEMMYTAASVSRKPGQEMEKAVTEWLDVAPILQHDGSQFTEIDAKSVLGAYDNMTAGKMLERFASEYGIGNVYDQSAMDILSNIKASSKRKIVQAIADNPDLEKGKVKKIVEKMKSLSASEKAEIKNLKEKVKSVLRRIPMALPKLGAVDLNSLLSTQDKDYFKATVGISVENFKELIENSVINSDWLNDCIISTVNYLARIENNPDALWKILELYASMGSEVSPGTPKNIANEMLDSLDESLWKDPTKTFCNPNVSDGTFYFLMIEKLMNGLTEAIPNEAERMRHILTNQIYGYDHKVGPLGFVKSIAERYFNTKALGIELNLEMRNILEEN